MTFEELKAKDLEYMQQTYGRFQVAIDRGKGATLWDVEGREYIDFTSGIGVNSIGYGHEKWVAAITEQAKKLGADLCIDPITEDVQQVLAQNGIGRIAVVIECVGKIKTQAQAIDIAGKKSTVMFFGLTAPEEELTIKPFTLFKKEIVLKASYINPYTQNRALTLIGSEKLDVSSMIYAREPLEKLPQLLADGATLARGKHLIHPND